HRPASCAVRVREAMAPATMLDTLPPAPAHGCAARLEAGEIIVATTATLLSESELGVLHGYNQVGRAHKNIAYSPRSGRLTGLRANPGAIASLEHIVATYADRITAWVARLCPDYAHNW